MNASDLIEQLRPFGIIVSRHAAAPEYQVLELSADKVKGASPFAVLEAYMPLGIETVTYVNASIFLELVKSLPRDHEVKLSAKQGVLSWECGPAKGKLEIKSAPDKVIEIAPVTGASAVPASLGLASVLSRGAISCDNEALAASGLYGVVVHSDARRIVACSTDNFTISVCEGPPVPGIPATATLPAKGTLLLANIMDSDGVLSFDGDMVVYRSPQIACSMRQIRALRTDILQTVSQYDGPYHAASKLPRARITSFIRRANVMAENATGTKVKIAVSDGNITLAFAEGIASSEEYILAENLGTFPRLLPVSLPAAKLARALVHTEEVILDYIDRGLIILRGGPLYSFRYMISGILGD